MLMKNLRVGGESTLLFLTARKALTLQRCHLDHFWDKQDGQQGA